MVAIRPALDGDIPAIHRIYAFHVVHGSASWEYEPPTAATMAERFASVRAGGFPYVVAEQDGAVVGYAYVSAFRARIGYRFTCEDSIYVAPGWQGRGIGRGLLARLVDGATAGGWRRMVAVIGDSENAASIALHRAAGFTLEADVAAIGWKGDRPLGWVLMARDLATAAPPAPALTLTPEPAASPAAAALLWGWALETGAPVSAEVVMVARLDGQPVGCAIAGRDDVHVIEWARGRGVEEALRRG